MATKKNELANADPFGAFVPAKPEDTSVRKRAKNWLERGKLIAPLSKEVREKTAEPNDFVFGGQNVGEETLVLVLARRDHALWIKDGSAHMESYDRDEEEYGSILEQVQMKTKGAMEGYDFLLWVPALNGYYYYHVAKTAMDYATDWQDVAPRAVGDPDFPKGRGPVPAILKNVEHPGSGKGRDPHYWNVPRLVPEPEMEVEVLPTPEATAKAIELFNNPRPQGRGDGEQEQKAPAKKTAAKSGGRSRRRTTKK